MHRVTMAVGALTAVVFAAPAVAQRAWEARPDLPLPPPVELPSVPAANPFASPVATGPVALASPMVEKVEQTFPSRVALSVDGDGNVRGVAVLELPLPTLGSDLRSELSDVRFTPARAAGREVGSVVIAALDLSGRIDEGRIEELRASAPDPDTPPEPAAPPAAEAIPTVASTPGPLAAMPAPRRVHVRLGSRTFVQRFRMLAEISPSGRCSRVVFLDLPEGLRGWFLSSLSSWSFQPASGSGGPVAAWALLEGSVRVELGTLRAEALRLSLPDPDGRGGPAADPPPGE